MKNFPGVAGLWRQAATLAHILRICMSSKTSGNIIVIPCIFRFFCQKSFPGVVKNFPLLPENFSGKKKLNMHGIAMIFPGVSVAPGGHPCACLDDLYVLESGWACWIGWLGSLAGLAGWARWAGWAPYSFFSRLPLERQASQAFSL